MTVTKKLPPLIFVLLLLFCHNVWAQTEKATIGIDVFSVEEITQKLFVNFDRDSAMSQRIRDGILDIKNQLVKDVTIDNNAPMLKKIAEKMGQSQYISTVKTMAEFTNEGREPTYLLTCGFYFDDIIIEKGRNSEWWYEFEIYPMCYLKNIKKENTIPFKTVYTFINLWGEPKNLDKDIKTMQRRLLEMFPKVAMLDDVIKNDLTDFKVSPEAAYRDEQSGEEEDLLADGKNTSLFSFYMIRQSVYEKPLREFTLEVDKGRFIHIPASLGKMSEDGKSVVLNFNNSEKHSKKHTFNYLYQTFDCSKEGGQPHKKAGSDKDWYTVKFTLKLTDMLSKKPKEDWEITREVELQCPPPTHFTANITRKTTKKVLDDPGYGYAGGNLLNSPFMTDRITTEKSKQVIYFDFANKKLLSVPLVPFHNVTKDNEYYEFNRDTCSVEYDRKVTTEKLSPHHKLLRYDGHLSTPFNPRTPMRFRFGNKDLQFSVQQLKRGGFSYHDTESRQLLPEMEYFIPSHRISGELGKLNHVMDITKAFAVTFEQMNGEDPCDVSALKREMDAFQDGVNNGFFAPQENEFTEYSVNIRRSSKGEIKLFNKQRKKMHARRFTKALEKVAIDEQKWKKYLPKELELIEKEKLNFEETMQLFAFPVLMLENFDQVLAGLSKEFDLEKLNQLKHLNEQQKRQLLEQLKQMTKAEQRDFLQQLSQSSSDNQAKMIEELVKQHQSK